MLNLAVVGSGAISLMVAIRRGMHEASIEPMGHIGSTRERDGTTVATKAPVMSSSEIASTTGMMNMLYAHFFSFSSSKFFFRIRSPNTGDDMIF